MISTVASRPQGRHSSCSYETKCVQLVRAGVLPLLSRQAPASAATPHVPLLLMLLLRLLLLLLRLLPLRAPPQPFPPACRRS